MTSPRVGEVLAGRVEDSGDRERQDGQVLGGEVVTDRTGGPCPVDGLDGRAIGALAASVAPVAQRDRALDQVGEATVLRLEQAHPFDEPGKALPRVVLGEGLVGAGVVAVEGGPEGLLDQRLTGGEAAIQGRDAHPGTVGSSGQPNSWAASASSCPQPPALRRGAPLSRPQVWA